MGTCSPRSAPELRRRLARLAARVAVAERRLEALRSRRLACGAACGAALLLGFAAQSAPVEFAAAAAFAAVFPWLVARSRRRARFLARLKALEAWYGRQLARRMGEAPRLPASNSAGGPTSASPASSDLALEGPRSLLSWLDETWTDEGREALRRRMTDSAPGSREEAESRTAIVRGLAQLRWPLARIGLEADRDDARVSAHELRAFCSRSLLPAGAGRAAAASLALWFLAIAGAGAWAAGFAPGRVASLVWVAYAVATFAILNSWGPVFLRAEGFAAHLGRLAPLLDSVEALARARPEMAAVAPRILQANPSGALRRLERAAALASVESNAILSALLNSAVPWSALADLRLEAARAAIARSLPAALDELAEVEAWSSLALYAATQGGAWPQWLDEAALAFEGLAHPLLPAERAVPSDLTLGDPSGASSNAPQGARRERLTLLTGSNMAGKSTFLRAMGLNQILANMGAPARAARYACGPLAVETCIQIADSLSDGVSYFYAEVLRLKQILAAASSGRPTLVLIDEIFRGTNNRERRAGSEAVIRALASKPGALAAVSTHDLELAALESSCPGLMNRHFRDEVVDGRLAFDYRLRPGQCPTTNALRLMRLEGLPVPEAPETP